MRDLRQYASTLKDKLAMPGEFLVAAVRNALVTILCENSHLLLKIGNEAVPDENGAINFMPRSINERVQIRPRDNPDVVCVPI